MLLDTQLINELNLQTHGTAQYKYDSDIRAFLYVNLTRADFTTANHLCYISHFSFGDCYFRTWTLKKSVSLDRASHPLRIAHLN